MRSRDVVGRRIVSVRFERISGKDSNSRRPFTVVAAIVLDDGSALVPHACETECEPVGTLVYRRSPTRGAVRVECEHGYDACPKCDATQTKGE